jgi:hypothetical protein
LRPQTAVRFTNSLPRLGIEAGEFWQKKKQIYLYRKELCKISAEPVHGAASSEICGVLKLVSRLQQALAFSLAAVAVCGRTA